jgi:hypothetical protein
LYPSKNNIKRKTERKEEKKGRRKTIKEEIINKDTKKYYNLNERYKLDSNQNYEKISEAASRVTELAYASVILPGFKSGRRQNLF